MISLENYERQLVIQVGVVVEGCNMHVGPVTYVDRDRADVKFKSLFDNKEYGCDLYHCGVCIQSEEEIEFKTDLYNTGGHKALLDYYNQQQNFQTQC